MNGVRIPVFERGNILTTDMLESVKELALDYPSVRYIGYSDGILTGCQVEANDTTLVVKEGILVQNGRLYYLSSPLTVSYGPSDEWMVFQLAIGNEIRYRNVTEQRIEAILVKAENRRQDAIEVCRFRLQPGAVLRTEYRNFQDQETEYDTINEIYADWSSYEQPTVSFRLLRLFAKEMETRTLTDAIDYLFCQQIHQTNGQALNRRTIETYLNQKLQLKKEHYTNQEIYQRLAEILRTSQGRSMGMPERQTRRTRIIVD